jgi:hypothetical protein
MPSVNRDILTSYLPICIPFISSSCLVVLTRNLKTVLSRSGKRRHCCLVSDFRGKSQKRFAPLGMILAIGVNIKILLENIF